MSTERNTEKFDGARSRIGLRRLTARSVLLSVLLGTEPAWLPTPLLLSTTALFGIADGTARTALSRMTATGEVEPHRNGYRLASIDLLDRQARQSTGRTAHTTAWDGTWRQVIVGIGDRRTAAERAGVRSSLRALRYGELREGVWLRPANLVDHHALEHLGDDALVADVSLRHVDSAELVGALWDLDGWVAAATELGELMGPLTGDLESGEPDALADGFVLNAAALRHLTLDPLLPIELQPQGWNGAQFRAVYERFDDAFRHVIQQHFATARGLDNR